MGAPDGRLETCPHERDDTAMDADRGVETQFADPADGDSSSLGAAPPHLERATDWSPPQFSLKNIFLLTILAAAFFAVIRYTGPDGIFPTIMVGCLLWLSIGCWRLFRLARRNGGYGDTQNDGANDDDWM